MQKIELTLPKFALLLFAWSALMYIGLIIFLPQQPEFSFHQGWACSKVHTINTSQADQNFITLETYSSAYCREFAEAWDERTVGDNNA